MKQESRPPPGKGSRADGVSFCDEHKVARRTHIAAATRYSGQVQLGGRSLLLTCHEFVESDCSTYPPSAENLISVSQFLTCQRLGLTSYGRSQVTVLVANFLSTWLANFCSEIRNLAGLAEFLHVILKRLQNARFVVPQARNEPRSAQADFDEKRNGTQSQRAKVCQHAEQ